jgi:hydroxyquinol 1,2-dioxygenase
VHFRIAAPGRETLVTHLFLAGSPYLDSDVVFGVKDSLVEPLVTAQPGTSPHGARIEAALPALRRDFVLAPAAGARA